jgi:chemotaxis protein histidine kinase CheA
MKRVFLVMVVSAMLVTFGFAQTPDASSDSDLAAVKGCLGGAEGNYTVVQDGTGQLFQITTSSIDLKAHLGHDVKVTGHKAAGAANSLTASEVSMISEHCAAAAAAIPAAVTPSPETVVTPDPAAAPPATASSPTPDVATPAAATASTPVVEPAVPAATVNPAPAPIATPPVEAAAPPATASPSPATVTSHVVEEAAPAPRPSAHAHKVTTKQAATDKAADAASATNVSPSPEPVAAAAKDATTPVTTAAATPQTATSPDAAAVAPAPAVTHKTGSLALLVSFVVLVIVLGTTAPLIGRWRKRKMLERDGAPNLSFTKEVGMQDVIVEEATTNEANTGRDKQEPRKIA